MFKFYYYHPRRERERRGRTGRGARVCAHEHEGEGVSIPRLCIPQIECRNVEKHVSFGEILISVGLDLESDADCALYCGKVQKVSSPVCRRGASGWVFSVVVAGRGSCGVWQAPALWVQADGVGSDTSHLHATSRLFGAPLRMLMLTPPRSPPPIQITSSWLRVTILPISRSSC